MTATEIREAAEAIGTNAECTCDPEVGITNCMSCDLNGMVGYILNLIPPDPDKLADEEWLRERFGEPQLGVGCLYWNLGGEVTVMAFRGGGLRVHAHGVHIIDNPTRLQVALIEAAFAVGE